MRTSPHRAALDHVLTLVAESDLAHVLVLRGSMTMPAWVADAAREPGDLDWIVRAPAVVQVGLRDPGPYRESLAPVQHWPEAVHGAARNEMWEFEEFDTGGLHPRLPPEGLHWVTEAGEDFWEDEFATLLREAPRAAGGIEFDPTGIVWSSDGDYGYDDEEYADYDEEGENRRVRLRLPWRSAEGETGEVRVDLAFGERLPDRPVCTAVPRTGGLPPVALWTATRALSLAWKLHWLAADQHTHGVSAMKDLYDAVLLAELTGIDLRAGLHHLAFGEEGLDAYARGCRDSWRIEGEPPSGGTPASWLTRLAEALTRLP